MTAAAGYNSRSLQTLRDLGFTAQVVERYDAYTRRRHDLFGIIDILAVGNGETLAVQVTSRSNMSSRRNKMNGDPILAELLRAGWRVELWGWDQPGGSRTRWRLKTENMDR